MATIFNPDFLVIGKYPWLPNLLENCEETSTKSPIVPMKDFLNEKCVYGKAITSIALTQRCYKVPSDVEKCLTTN